MSGLRPLGPSKLGPYTSCETGLIVHALPRVALHCGAPLDTHKTRVAWNHSRPHLITLIALAVAFGALCPGESDNGDCYVGIKATVTERR